MKRRNIEQSRSIKTLKNYKRQGKKSVLWTLKEDTLEYCLDHYQVVPELYKITTRKFKNEAVYKNTPILKTVHYAKISGKDTLIRKNLTKKEKSILESWGIKVTEYKYRIYLN